MKPADVILATLLDLGSVDLPTMAAEGARRGLARPAAGWLQALNGLADGPHVVRTGAPRSYRWALTPVSRDVQDLRLALDRVARRAPWRGYQGVSGASAWRSVDGRVVGLRVEPARVVLWTSDGVVLEVGSMWGAEVAALEAGA